MGELGATSTETLACWGPDPHQAPSKPRPLYLTFGTLQDVLQGVANLLEPPPERLVYRLAHL